MEAANSTPHSQSAAGTRRSGGRCVAMAEQPPNQLRERPRQRPHGSERTSGRSTARAVPGPVADDSGDWSVSCCWTTPPTSAWRTAHIRMDKFEGR